MGTRDEIIAFWKHQESLMEMIYYRMLGLDDLLKKVQESHEELKKRDRMAEAVVTVAKSVMLYYGRYKSEDEAKLATPKEHTANFIVYSMKNKKLVDPAILERVSLSLLDIFQTLERLT